MTEATDIQPTRSVGTEPSEAPVRCAATGYAPVVGDCFRKPAGTYTHPLTRKVTETPEQRAEVTMTDGRHVVCVINGLEYTLPMADFVRLAAKTLANGATLRRAGHSAAGQRQAPAQSQQPTENPKT